MKTALLLCFFAALYFNCYSQAENNNWYFGDKAAINFSANGPIVINGSVMDQLEGCSSISNKNGNLLFYTDGISVWNRENKTMTNGEGLHGNTSSTQSAYIVPWPLNDSLYYIFTTDAQGGSFGLQYSVVNMHLNNGLGDVTEKNILLSTPVAEKITAIKHANDRDIWVISHKFDGSKDFISFLITSSGITLSPVVSTAGTEEIYVDFFTNNSIGMMQASPNGDKIVSLVTPYNLIELFDFDKSSGKLSNAVQIRNYFPVGEMDQGESSGAYGLAFSPNGKLLYTTTGFKAWWANGPVPMSWGDQYVTQYDISLKNENDINNSVLKVLEITEKQATILGQMQLGPDNRIYFSNYGRQYLGVIKNPDVYGKQCDAIANGASIAPYSCRLGLPSFFNYYSTILASNWINFTVKLQNKNAILQWESMSDQNTDHYRVERSYDAKKFIAIGDVPALYSGLKNNYSFTDDISKLALETATLFYRLRQIKKDGTANFSKVVQVNDLISSSDLVIAPNPTSDVLRLSLKNILAPASVSVFDFSGKRLLIQPVYFSGNAVINLNVSSLARGNYLLVVKGNGYSKTRKFSRQ